MSKTNLIFTCREEFSNIAKNEIKSINITTEIDKWLGEGVGKASTEISFENFSEEFIKSNPIFTRHINPIDTIIELNFTQNDFSKINSEIITKIIPKLDSSKSFSVQTRVLHNVSIKSEEYSKFQFNNKISEIIIEKTNATLDVKNPSQVISVVLAENMVYMGYSLVTNNLSNWAGGERRFAKEKEQISRAEFKLLEAIENFKLNLSNMTYALDLGASPGGWTRILREYYDMRVTAVDPALIDPSLEKDKKVKHIKKTSQKYAMTNKLNYDIIVNDMKIDTHESVNVMGELAKYLNEKGIAIMTLKLPTKNISKVIKDSLYKLSKYYKIVGARQLFHNRHEITVVLGKNNNQ